MNLAWAVFLPVLSNLGDWKMMSSVCHWPGGLAAFFTQTGILRWGPEELAFEVPAGRTVVLPSQLGWIESRGWVFVADVTDDSAAL